MKRILIISPFFYPHIGGSQQYMEDMYACLVKKYPQIQVDVLCYQTIKTSSFEQYRGMNIYRLPAFQILPGQFCLPNPLSLLKFIYKKWGTYDLVHCNTRFFDTSWWTPILAKLTGKKIIITDHCADSPTHESALIAFISKVIDRTVAGFFLRFYTRIFTTNKAAQRFLKQAFNIQSKVIYGGVNTEIFKPKHLSTVIPATSLVIPAKAGIQLAKRTWIPDQVRDDNKRLRILYSGRMIPSKGVLELFDVAKDIKNADFIFAGPGPLVEILKKEVKKQSLNHIKITGGLDKRGVAKLLSDSDIFVHPSFHHEGFPNALTEAGATKIAVIATDVGGSGEIIIDGKTGILIKPKDVSTLKNAIETLLKNKNLREKLAENLYDRIMSNFTWEKASEEMYEEIVSLLHC